jgi:hypothetical protein
MVVYLPVVEVNFEFLLITRVVGVIRGAVQVRKQKNQGIHPLSGMSLKDSNNSDTGSHQRSVQPIFVRTNLPLQ